MTLQNMPVRLLRLLSLLQSRPEWSGDELASELAVSTRTVRRDVERLRDLDYTIEASRGVAGGYRMAAAQTLPPLLLDHGEAVAVVAGLVTGAGGTIAEDSSLRALAKLTRLLPTRMRARLTAITNAPSLFQARKPAVLTRPLSPGSHSAVQSGSASPSATASAPVTPASVASSRTA